MRQDQPDILTDRETGSLRHAVYNDSGSAVFSARISCICRICWSAPNLPDCETPPRATDQSHHSKRRGPPITEGACRGARLTSTTSILRWVQSAVVKAAPGSVFIDNSCDWLIDWLIELSAIDFSFWKMGFDSLLAFSSFRSENNQTHPPVITLYKFSAVVSRHYKL